MEANKEDVVNGIDAEIVGRRIHEAIKKDEFYIFTHHYFREVHQERSEAITKGFDNSDISPALKDVPRKGKIHR